MRSLSGFAMIEFLMVTAMIALLGGLTALALEPVYSRYQLRSAEQGLIEALWQAQSKARASETDSAWSVHVAVGSITIFQGISFASRQTSYDEVTDISSAIVPGSATDVIFQKMTGYPTTASTMTLTNANLATTITVNDRGMVSH